MCKCEFDISVAISDFEYALVYKIDVYVAIGEYAAFTETGVKCVIKVEPRKDPGPLTSKLFMMQKI